MMDAIYNCAIVEKTKQYNKQTIQVILEFSGQFRGLLSNPEHGVFMHQCMHKSLDVQMNECTYVYMKM